MNTDEIPKKLMELHTAIIDKTGKRSTSPTMFISARDNKAFWDEMDMGGRQQYIKSNTAEGFFKAAYKTLGNLPSQAELELAEFQKDLSKLIDKGRKYSIDLEFVNPLASIAKKLASNAIAHEVVE